MIEFHAITARGSFHLISVDGSRVLFPLSSLAGKPENSPEIPQPSRPAANPDR